MSKPTRNPTWQRDELILALDLYFRCPPSKYSKSSKEIVALSALLNRLPIHEERPDISRFRNPNGVFMKLCNFLRFDPSYKGKGLRRGGKEEEAVWHEFANDQERLRKIASAISMGVTEKKLSASDQNELEESVFPEGKIVYRMHRRRERNSTLIKKAKEQALKKGGLACQVCRFDFQRTYGVIGHGFIECHHTIPVSDYASRQNTKVEDLVLVCANCHRMLHRKRPWLSADELSKLLK